MGNNPFCNPARAGRGERAIALRAGVAVLKDWSTDGRPTYKAGVAMVFQGRRSRGISYQVGCTCTTNR
jgi:hypothetical protein